MYQFLSDIYVTGDRELVYMFVEIQILMFYCINV